MKKIKVLLFVLFFIISLGYQFITPSQTITTIDKEIHFSIYVEGLTTQQLYFDKVVCVKEVLEQLKIENRYGFNESRQLENKQTLYIPTTSKNKISLNHASKQQLMEVPGIGEVTASKIITYRSNQLFEIIEDIQEVDGIGYKTYLKMREQLCL